MIRHIDNFDLRQIADSGQCFRMKMADEDHAVIVAHGRVLEVRHIKDNAFEFDCMESDFNDIWSEYFDLDTDYGRFTGSIPESDRFLSAAASYGSGIRILKQDKFETLITFIISQRKNIPAIKASVEKLAFLCGDEISKGIFAFPSSKAIAELSDEDLRRCSLGYRAEYVRRAAVSVYHGDISLDNLCKLSDDDLFKSLTDFYGVGAKVANCVMLFAYHRIDAFPVDVWISRVIGEKYGGSFPLENYSGFAGVIQQYMFYYGRSLKL